MTKRVDIDQFGARLADSLEIAGIVKAKSAIAGYADVQSRKLGFVL